MAREEGGYLIWPGGGQDPGMSYSSLEMRRRIALALAARQKGYPKNLGEGLTALGEGIGEAGLMWRLEQAERARDAKLAKESRQFTEPTVTTEPTPQRPSVAPRTEAPVDVAPAPVSSADPGAFPDPPMRTAALPPEVPPDVVADTGPPPGAASLAPQESPVADRFNAAFTSTAPAPEPSPNAQVASRFAPAMQQPLTRAMPSRNDLVFDPTQAQGGVQPDVSNLPAASFAGRTYSDPQLAALNAPLSPVQPPPELAQAPQGPPQGAGGPMTLPTAAVNPPVDPRAPQPGPMAMPRPRPQIPEPQQAAAAPSPSGIPFEGPQMDPRSQARMAASRGIESGGNRDPYNMLHAVTKTGDRAVGAYGIMGRNVGPWTEKALGYRMTPEQFRGNRNAQDITFRQKFEGDYIPKYGDEGAARAWYAGERGMKNLAKTDQHGRLTVAGYGQDFTRRMGLPGEPGGGGTAITVNAGPRERVAAALMQQDEPSPRELLSDALLAEVVGGSGGGRGVQTAALGRGDVASDAPPVDVGPITGGGIADAVRARRNAITNTIQQQQQTPAPAVPQPDPTKSGAISPPTSTGSEPATITTDIQPMPAGIRPGDVLAQARGGQGAAPQVAPPPVGQQQTAAPYEMQPPVKPTLPPEPPMGERERKAMQWKMANPGDPDVARIADQVITSEKEKRSHAYARSVEQYKADMDIYKQQTTTYDTFQRERDKNAAALGKAWSEASDAQQKAADTKRFGREPEKFFTDFSKQKDAAAMNANVLRQSQLAKEAIKNGIITGFGAERRIDLAKLRDWMFNNKVEGDLASNSELMSAAVKSMLSVAVQNIQGTDSRVTDSDIKVASGTIGADPKLQLATIQKIINENERVARTKIADYEDQHHHYLSGHGAEKAFEVKAPPSAPQPYIERLLEFRTNREARDEFDKRFGEGAAELEIARAKRRQRQGG